VDVVHVGTPAFANKAFVLRWSNGTEVPLDSSFEKFVDVIISGLEEDLRAAGGR
jgi:TetR/AcrR family transcriptional regulator, tetracycline repressor protein